MDAGFPEEAWDDVSVSIVLIVVFVSLTGLSKQIQMMLYGVGDRFHPARSFRLL
jgi:hypothetical protein